uniref:Uncharacterized protein n=1 Tax=Chenopodium quinoa TaxID=63459 RepID=A0A803M2N2_CHEQI
MFKHNLLNQSSKLMSNFTQSRSIPPSQHLQPVLYSLTAPCNIQEHFITALPAGEVRGLTNEALERQWKLGICCKNVIVFICQGWEPSFSYCQQPKSTYYYSTSNSQGYDTTQSHSELSNSSQDYLTLLSSLETFREFTTEELDRNLNVAEDNDPGTDTDADDEDLISGLQCKVVVQFDQYKEFYNALKVLCSRSLKKEGSRMKADCELTWDKDGFFQHARRYTQEGNSRIPTVGAGQYRNERRSSYNSRHSPDDE